MSNFKISQTLITFALLKNNMKYMYHVFYRSICRMLSGISNDAADIEAGCEKKVHTSDCLHSKDSSL